MDVKTSIQRYIEDELMFGDGSVSISAETSLCEGIIDSLALIDLVLFLEQRFGIEIDDADLTAENFRTIAAIERLVSRRTAGA